MYYGWSKEFLKAGKRRLADDRMLLPFRATAQLSLPGSVSV